MKYSPTLIFLFFSIMAIAQTPELHISTDKIGVNTTTPNRQFQIEGYAAATSHILYSRANFLGTFDVRAIEGYSITNPGYGIGGYFSGGYRGVYALNDAQDYSGSDTYGLYARATGTSATATRIGLFAEAFGGAENIAAKFGNGDVEISNNTRIGALANDLARLQVSNSNTTYSGNARSAFFQTTHDGDEDVYGVSVTTTSNGAGNVYGDRITSFGFDAGATVYGTYTTAVGANATMIGLYAGAAGGSQNIAARFGNGDVEIENRLRVNTTSQNAVAHIKSTNNTGGNATALRIESNNDGNEPTYGTLVTTNNTSNGNSYGHYASVSASGANNKAYAIYGLASDPEDFAFYGVGNTFLSGDLRIGQNVDPHGGDYKVVVDGKILSEEVRVQNSIDWPDYVFAEDYNLMPLTGVEAHITAHQHLPNIPPAHVIEVEGIALGEMQIKMMEKIEELTLYIIAQQKQIDTLATELQSLHNEK